MMTVRFPNGQAVQYSDAVNFHYYSDTQKYLIDKNGHWLALVPNSCIIENVRACRVYNPISNVTNEELESLKKEIQSMKRKLYRMK
jgi:hypothetical protein